MSAGRDSAPLADGRPLDAAAPWPAWSRAAVEVGQVEAAA